MQMHPQRRFVLLAAAAVATTLLVGCQSAYRATSSHATSSGLRDASAAKMAEAAQELIASLTEEQRKAAVRPFEGSHERTSWSNLPASIVPRVGARIGDLTDEQRQLVHALLRASTSSQGYLKMASLVQLDERLGREADSAVASGTRKLPPDLVESWTSANYWIRIFGDPHESTWGWQLSGHHLGANFTVVDGATTLAPTFLGAEPNEVREGLDAGWMVLGHEADRGFDLMASLSADQRSEATLGADVPRDIFTAPGRKDALSEPQGLAGSALDADQQTMLWRLVDEYVNNANPDAAATHSARIRADGIGALHFAWLGPTGDKSARYYYRVHGPSVLIEYVVEPGVGGKAANHVHSIVRDPKNDYGADWLQQHYEEHHPVRIAAGARASNPKPTKGAAADLLTKLCTAVEQHDVDAILGCWHTSPEIPEAEMRRHFSRKNAIEINRETLDKLIKFGKWGPISEVYPSTGANLSNVLERWQLDASQCWALRLRPAEVALHWDGKEFHVIECDDVNKPRLLQAGEH